MEATTHQFTSRLQYRIASTCHGHLPYPSTLISNFHIHYAKCKQCLPLSFYRHEHHPSSSPAQLLLLSIIIHRRLWSARSVPIPPTHQTPPRPPFPPALHVGQFSINRLVKECPSFPSRHFALKSLFHQRSNLLLGHLVQIHLAQNHSDCIDNLMIAWSR